MAHKTRTGKKSSGTRTLAGRGARATVRPQRGGATRARRGRPQGTAVTRRAPSSRGRATASRVQPRQSIGPGNQGVPAIIAAAQAAQQAAQRTFSQPASTVPNGGAAPSAIVQAMNAARLAAQQTFNRGGAPRPVPLRRRQGQGTRRLNFRR
ncbi:MAG: hypothetical protein QQN63_04845 [Nitrosopumilus sp.]